MMTNVVDTLVAIDDLLNQAIEIAHVLPETTVATYRDQQEAMVHRVSIRLGILERVLNRAHVYPAKIEETVMLDRRIQELKGLGVDVPEQDIPDLDEGELEYITALINDVAARTGMTEYKIKLLDRIARLNQRAQHLAEAMNRHERKEG